MKTALWSNNKPSPFSLRLDDPEQRNRPQTNHRPMNENTAKDTSSSPTPPGGFAVVSQFTVANGMTEAVKTAFRHRLRQVEHASGFVRLEVLSPMDCPDEIWLLTFWRDEASFRSWYRSHDYHQAHQGIPKGLKLVPGRTIIRHFEHVCS